MNVYETLSDSSPMPFGKHKGVAMQDVPAGYLHWLWTNGLEYSKADPVAEYIRENMSALKVEYPDGIWE